MLSAQEERFCYEMATGKSKTKYAAAIAAGYSEKSAGVIASRLLRKVKISGRIKELQREILAESGYDAIEIKKLLIRKLVNIVMADQADYMTISKADDPNRAEVLQELAELSGGQMALDFGEVIMLPSTSLPLDTRAAIKSIKLKSATIGKESVIYPEMELHDPLQAAKLLAEITGIKQSDGSVDINITPAAILEKAYERRSSLSNDADADEREDTEVYYREGTE